MWSMRRYCQCSKRPRPKIDIFFCEEHEARNFVLFVYTTAWLASVVVARCCRASALLAETIRRKFHSVWSLGSDANRVGLVQPKNLPRLESQSCLGIGNFLGVELDAALFDEATGLGA